MLISSLFRTLVVAGSILTVGITGASAEAKKNFKVGWSIYVGWMPWGYAADTGIAKRWADKCNRSPPVRCSGIMMPGVWPFERRVGGLRFGANRILRLACLPDSPLT